MNRKEINGKMLEFLDKLKNGGELTREDDAFLERYIAGEIVADEDKPFTHEETIKMVRKLKIGEDLNDRELEFFTLCGFYNSHMKEEYEQEDDAGDGYHEMKTVVNVDGDLFAMDWTMCEYAAPFNIYTQPYRVKKAVKTVEVEEVEYIPV